MLTPVEEEMKTPRSEISVPKENPEEKVEVSAEKLVVENNESEDKSTQADDNYNYNYNDNDKIENPTNNNNPKSGKKAIYEALKSYN